MSAGRCRGPADTGRTVKTSRAVLAACVLLLAGITGRGVASDLDDSHLHLTNYVQEGPTLARLLVLMGDRTGRAAVFGIPMQQKWDAFETGDRAPDYYLLTDSELYYYSFTDAVIAQQYLRLPPASRARLHPLISGFNPSDMYAVDHVRRVLRTYPGVFTGIGEFAIKKEFVSSKVAGHAASLRNPALDRLLSFAGEAGLIVLVHSDINTIQPAPGRPAHLDATKAVFRAHQDAVIVWAHTGLGRFVGPTPDHVALLAELLDDPGYAHVNLDISWHEVAKWVVAGDASLDAWAALIRRYPDRFLFGSDAVAPRTQAELLRTYVGYQPLWDRLDADTAARVKSGNFARLFDAARAKVRAWESRQPPE